MDGLIYFFDQSGIAIQRAYVQIVAQQARSSLLTERLAVRDNGAGSDTT